MMLHAANNREIRRPQFIHQDEVCRRKQFEEPATGMPVIRPKKLWAYPFVASAASIVTILYHGNIELYADCQAWSISRNPIMLHQVLPRKSYILTSNRMRLLLNPLSRRWLHFVGIVLLMQIHVPTAESQLRNPDLAEVATLAEVAREVAELTSKPLDDDAIHRLIEIDEALPGRSPGAKSLSDTQRRILKSLATSQQEAGLAYVRSVFENAPERRGSAAAALAAATTLRPTDLQDWTFMVRSLPVVQGDEARAVLNALARFRNRANKGVWVRQVILVGLQLPPDQQDTATSLLRHWTGVPLKKSEASAWTLRRYQEWFSKEYHDQPEPKLPVDSTERKWTMATLENSVHDFVTTDAMKQLGERVYEKAGCQKCHRRGKVGEALGPDLTSLGWRRQRREILLATLFPSHELNEEYPTVTVSLKSGKTLTGMMSASTAETLAIVSNTGMREEFPRSEVDTIINQKVSNMPEGLLEPLSMDEILSLIAWLSSVDGVPRPHTDEG